MWRCIVERVLTDDSEPCSVFVTNVQRFKTHLPTPEVLDLLRINIFVLLTDNSYCVYYVGTLMNVSVISSSQKIAMWHRLFW
jgi:hypothetical protein